MNIDDLKTLYCGFYLEGNCGNNAFSYEGRQNRRIYVPPLVAGTINDVALGDHVVFSEMDEGIEVNRTGLGEFVYTMIDGRHIFIFDNHNHAFFFWLAGFRSGIIKRGLRLVHVDQHSDMRKPASWYAGDPGDKIDLAAAFHYTNYDLNVGNFIQPALKLGLFDSVDLIDSSTSFEKQYEQEIVLDIDIDVFAPELEYIPTDYKLGRIREWVKQSRFITVATSPFFIDQHVALERLREIF